MSNAFSRAPDRRRYRDGVRAALPLGLVAATATTALARLLL